MDIRRSVYNNFPNVLEIEGAKELSGKVHISGSKNASLPILAASILVNKICLTNVPFIIDTYVLSKILEDIGVRVWYDRKNKKLFTLNNNAFPENVKISYSLASRIRASLLILGPLLTKVRRVIMALPGGDPFLRNVNFHVNGLRMLGVKCSTININGKVYLAFERKDTKRKKDKVIINLPYPSVGATINLIAASQLAKEVIITNISVEPEVIEFIRFLKKIGYVVNRINYRTVKVITKNYIFHDIPLISHTIPYDRIESLTFISLGVLVGKNFQVNNVPLEHLTTPLRTIKKVINDQYSNNFIIQRDMKSIVIEKPPSSLKPFKIVTKPHPGFPTDAHSFFVVIATRCNGKSNIKETIYSGRSFLYVSELKKMGARIYVNGDELSIYGHKNLKLNGGDVVAKDIRGGAALAIAALTARGLTKIEDAYHIYRGYENFHYKLNNVGARVDYHFKCN